MKIYSISFKLFISIILLCLLFLNIIMVLQTVLFDRFYDYRREVEIERSVDSLKGIQSEDDLESTIGRLISDNNYGAIIIYNNARTIYNLSGDIEEVVTQEINNGIVASDRLTYLDGPNAGVYSNTIVYMSRINYKAMDIVLIDDTYISNNLRDSIQYFYILLFLTTILIVIIISYMFSMFISKPLVKMDRIAKKMAALDFTEKLDIDSNDEIGSLAESLNQLSNNLKTSMDSLESNNKRLREFTAEVSHELKTPLAIIGGYVEGIRDGIYTGEAQEMYLAHIQVEIEKMDKMIKDMLYIFKTDDDSYKLRKENINLGKLIANMVERYDRLAIDKDIKISTSIDKELIGIFGDREKLERALDNLMSNAIKYTDKGGSIFVKLCELKGRVRFSIENTYESLENEELSRIWDRFYRLDKSRSKAITGTGLGLSIVANILKLHDFEYGVRNTELGLEFYFYIS